MAKIRLKELGILGIVLGLTMEAPAFADDAQGDAEVSDQPTATMQDNGEDSGENSGENGSAMGSAGQGDVRKKQDEAEGDTEGGMVKEDSAGFGSGGEAMPGTDLPEPPAQGKDKKQ
nr:hypothetical protein [uncultured Halomonas sp.]